MPRTSLLRTMALAALGWLLLLAAPTAAFPSTGPCSLMLLSSDSLGTSLDTVKSGDQSASPEDPFLVDWNGIVGWDARVAAPLQDYHYEVAMFGIPTPLRGGSANTSDTRRSTGAFAFTGEAAFRFTGTYYLTVQISGSGAECQGEMVVKLVGDPVGTIPFFVGLSLIAIGVLLATWGWKGHVLAGVFGGAFLGLGLSITLIVYSILPLGGVTPAVATIAGLLLGLAALAGGRIRLVILGRAPQAVVAGVQLATDGSDPAHEPRGVAEAATTGSTSPAPIAPVDHALDVSASAAEPPVGPPVGSPVGPPVGPPAGPGSDPA